MTTNDEELHDLRIETRQIKETLNQLVTTTAVMSSSVELLTKEVIPKLNKLEEVQHHHSIKISNNELVISGVKWLAAAVITVAIGLIAAYIFKG